MANRQLASALGKSVQKRHFSSLLVISSLVFTGTAGPVEASTVLESRAKINDSLTLDLGEVVEIALPQGETSIELSGADGESYIMALISLSMRPMRSYGYGVGEGVKFKVPQVPAMLHPSNDISWEAPASKPQSMSWVPSHGFDGDVEVDASLLKSLPVKELLAAVGDVDSFTVTDGRRVFSIDAECVQVTDELIVYIDITTENPLGEIPPETLDEVSRDFESIILPRERQEFGFEPDVNSDGHVTVLYSYTVNQYGAVAYVAPCDLLSPSECPFSNFQEMTYVSIPEPDDSYSEPNSIEELIGHEFNHILYFDQKYIQHDAVGGNENVYLTEGMAELAQDITGYNNGLQYIWWAALEAVPPAWGGINDVSMADVITYNPFRYYIAQRDGSLRGAAYLYLRYLFEQAGSMSVMPDGTLVDTGGMTFLHDYLSYFGFGADTIEGVTGQRVEDTIKDFFTAMMVDGRVDDTLTPISTDPLYNFEPRLADPITGYEFGVDLFGEFHGWVDLNGPDIQTLAENDGKLRSGGVEYLEINPEGASEIVSISVDPKASAVIRLVRVQ